MRGVENIQFDKWNGAGNDFIILDNRKQQLKDEDIQFLSRKLCDRHMSLGADGLITVESSFRGQLKIRFFNPDGSEFTMCMNGSRCTARYAFLHVLAPARMTLETRIGIIHASIEGEQVRISFYRPYELNLGLKLNVGQRGIPAYFIKVGDPHVVIPVTHVDDLDVDRIGRKLRFHPDLGPEGANINFVRVSGPNVTIRTYERGVEAETYGCGSGCVSTALVLAHLGRRFPEYKFHTRSGVTLVVSLQWEGDQISRIVLVGDARQVATGVLPPDAWNWNET